MSAPRYLFSVDVEDPRDEMAEGDRFPDHVPALVETFLEFLQRSRGSGTFFFVGPVARRHPELVRTVASEGHELGCHSDRHLPLTRLDRASFRDDVLRNLEALDSAGSPTVRGYRAPCFSLTEQSSWAHEVLAECGFLYSSSVLPARNPRFGWRGFGPAPRLVDGVLEIPVTILPLPRVPLGGLYFRVMPLWLLRNALSRHARSLEPVRSYHHPYDIDPESSGPAFDLPLPFRLLMRVGRRAVIPRLEMAARLGFEFAAYGPFAEEQFRMLEARRTGHE